MEMLNFQHHVHVKQKQGYQKRSLTQCHKCCCESWTQNSPLILRPHWCVFFTAQSSAELYVVSISPPSNVKTLLHTHASEIGHLNQLVNSNNTIRKNLPMHLTQLENCFMEHLMTSVVFHSNQQRNDKTSGHLQSILVTCTTILCFGQGLVGWVSHYIVLSSSPNPVLLCSIYMFLKANTLCVQCHFTIIYII